MHDLWPRVMIGMEALANTQLIVSGPVKDGLSGSRTAIVDYSFALTEEVHEIARELSWRPWRTPKPPDVEKVTEEFADLLAFLGVMIVNAATACGMRPAEFAEMIAKQYGTVSVRNFNRFKEKGVDTERTD